MSVMDIHPSSKEEAPVSIEGLKTDEEVFAEDMRDPEFRAAWERMALAHAVALEVLKYRTDQGLSQRALAERLGMKQPQVARLEIGEHTPTIETLARLAAELGIEFTIDIRPPGRRPRFVTKRAQEKNRVASFSSGGAEVLLAAG